MQKIKELYQHFLLSDGVSTDSRKDVTNKIFFAITGDNFDGNKFAPDAINKGAKLGVVDDTLLIKDDRYFFVPNVLAALQELAKFHRKKSSATVFAITGSNGKTTTKELISIVLKDLTDIISTDGNYNNHIGVPLTLLKIKPTTKIAVVEMGANHIGEIKKLCEIAQPNVGLITNIGKAHLDGFGSLVGVITAKNELYNYLKSNNGKAIVNSDDELLADLSKNILQFTYGTKNADVVGEMIDNKPHVKIRWESNEKIYECNSQLYGEYNFNNLMAAIATGMFFSVPAQTINRTIANYIPQNNRSQQIQTKTNHIILDAYNANPSSVGEAIASFVGHEFKDSWLILGDMFELGDYSMDEHQLIVDNLLKEGVKNVILIGKDFSNTHGHNFSKFISPDDAKMHLSKIKVRNSTILVKGSRGMELEKLLDVL
jgi:UDP-N-acetylmuramoyl-tripeptide--D-alanyl-D-alanine ligase